MRLDDLPTLPPTLTTAQAAEALGVGKDLLWKLAREGTAPVEPLRLGATLRWPTAKLVALLGVDLAATPAAEDELARRRLPSDEGHAA